jgi:predicted DNA-binding protein (MmcQ/YjbR family)
VLPLGSASVLAGRWEVVGAVAKRTGVRERLRVFALGLPGAYEEFPWGEVVVKVNRKVFLFLGEDDAEGAGTFALKLRESLDHALSIEGAEPTGYGLGKHGWVSIPARGRLPPIGVLRDFVDESYRLVAPRRLVAELDSATAGGAPGRRRAEPSCCAKAVSQP